MEELKRLLKEQGTAFEDFKSTNDARIKSLEEKGTVDPLLETKLENLNGELTSLSSQIKDLTKKANRPGTSAEGKENEVAEHKDAFYNKFMRKGDVTDLADLETKAVNVGTPGEGGYAVPIDQDKTILDLMRDGNPMRQLCTVIQVGTSKYKKLVNLHGTNHGWVGETAPRPATDGPLLAIVEPSMGELYANPEATQESLDDIFFNVESWLAQELADGFGDDEGAAFVSGDAANKPRGFLDYGSATTADNSRAFGILQHLSAAAATAVTGDELIDTIYSLKKGMRKRAIWQMASLTLASIRKMKNNDDEYLWQPGLQAGQPDKLLGYKLEENDDMPVMASGNAPIAFGDWKRGYCIVDRMGIRSLRDPYSNKPFVGFYTAKRVGGMVVDSQAIKLIQMS